MRILRAFTPILLVPMFAAAPQDTGSVVKGVVRLKGDRPPAVMLRPDHDETDVLAMYPGGVPFDPVEADSQKRIRSVLVYVKKGLEGKIFDPPQDPVLLEFDRFRVRPRMLGIQVGQTLVLTNKDSIVHSAHVFTSESSGNKETNDILSGGGGRAQRTFAKPELGVEFHDDRHPRIARAWISVLPHPYFCVTGPAGEYQIRGLPPGKYTIETWQENCSPQIRNVEVGDQETKSVDFELEAAKPR